jgi:hypothetical protein
MVIDDEIFKPTLEYNHSTASNNSEKDGAREFRGSIVHFAPMGARVYGTGQPFAVVSTMVVVNWKALDLFWRNLLIAIIHGFTRSLLASHFTCAPRIWVSKAANN